MKHFNYKTNKMKEESPNIQLTKELAEILRDYHYYKNGKELSLEDFLLWITSINMTK